MFLILDLHKEFRDVFDFRPWIFCGGKLNDCLAERPDVAASTNRHFFKNFGSHPKHTALDVVKLDSRMTDLDFRDLGAEDPRVAEVS